MPYDVFISYSRRDNEQGRCKQLVERIETDFAAFAGRPLAPFFDATEIHGMDDWRHRILQGLRESRLLLACLSPAYLQSEYCEWEFNEYLKHEIGRAYFGDGVAPIYFVQVPGWDDKGFEQQCAAWVAELRRRQHFDLRPWFRAGEESLRDATVQERMRQLNAQLKERITRGERAEHSLGNVDAHNPHFIGRTTELRRLRETVALGKVGVLTAVHGLGGVGKTALAIEYAHAFAHEYAGGRWQVRCEGKEDLRAAVAELAAPLRLAFDENEKRNIDLQFQLVLAELRRLANAHDPHRCLLLLDNVDKPRLLEPAQSQCLPSGGWLHVVATTRLGESDLYGRHKDRAFLPVDELPEADALELIESYQPNRTFSSDAEREAARAIVNLLGRFTLAVESAAVYLGQFSEDVTCAGFLDRLKKEGLDGLTTAARETSEGIRHGEMCLKSTLAPTLERLSEPEKLAMSYAALLPADYIPLPWIRVLVAEEIPAIGQDSEPGYSDPWKNTLRRLLSLRLVRAGEEQELVVMHRLVAQMVATKSANAARGESLRKHVFARIRNVKNAQSPPKKWELDALVGTLPGLLADDVGEPELAFWAVLFTDKVAEYGTLCNARSLLEIAHSVLARSAGTGPPDSGLQRQLALAHERLGTLVLDTGNASEGLKLFKAAREIYERLCDAEQGDMELRRELAVCHSKVADTLKQHGDLPGASDSYSKASALFEEALAVEPENLIWLRGYGVVAINAGDVEMYRGDLHKSRENYMKAQGIMQKLVGADGSNEVWRRDLATCHERFGDLFQAQGDIHDALGSYRAAEVILDRLFEENPVSNPRIHDASLLRMKIGDTLLAQGDPNGALAAYRGSLAVRQQLVAFDPSNDDWQRELWVCFVKIGEVLSFIGDLDGASESFSESKRIVEVLVRADPSSARWQRDLSLNQERIGEVLLAQGNSAGALRNYRESLVVRERLASADPSNAGWQRDLSISQDRIGAVLLGQGDLAGALNACRKSLAIRDRFASADPSNAGWQQDLSASHTRIGDVLQAAGDLGGALASYRAALVLAERMAASDPSNAEWQRHLFVIYGKMAAVTEASNPMESRRW